MGRTILITGWFDIYDQNCIKTGEKEFVVSHGIDEDTGRIVIVQSVPPLDITGSYYDDTIDEWVIGD